MTAGPRATAMLLGAAALAACATDSHVKKATVEGERLRLDLAETYVHRGAYTAAIPFLRRAVAEEPKSAHVHTLYGVVLRQQGLYPQAEAELTLATRLDPTSAEAFAALGILYDLTRRPPLAEEAHRRALALAPQSARYWNNLGFSLYVAGDDDGAIAALEKSLALDPGLLVAYNNLGFAYGRKGQLTDAERCFRTAGGELAALVNMAIVYDVRGNAAEAARLRAEAQARDPKSVPEVH